MANIQKLWTTYTELGNTGNQITGTTYIGQEGRLWYDPVTNTLRASDGNTAGGTIVGGITSTYAYGQFWSNASQTVASANTEYIFSFNNADSNSNVVLGTGASNSRIIINQTGLYNIQFSAQVDKALGGGTTASAYIWFKKNGTAIPDSSGFVTLDQNLQVVQSWNVLANVTSVGDYYEIAYAASSTVFSFPTIAGNVSVGYPASPSIIVTVTPVT
jgi:hypothetical protein